MNGNGWSESGTWASNARRRAEAAGRPAETVTRAEVWATTGGRCHLCGRPLDPRDWHVDHVVALAAGGYHTAANLRPACPGCNRRKGPRRPPDLPSPSTIEAMQTVLWRLGIVTRVVRVVPAPQCWTALLDLDPTRMPAAMRLAQVITAAIGSPQSVRLAQAGARLAVQIPRPRPRVVPLRLMRSVGRRVQVGVTASGRAAVVDLAHPMTAHVFVAGASGSGKSALLQAIVAGLAQGNAPDELRLALVDPKCQTFVGPLARLRHSLWRVARAPEEGRAVVRAVTQELARRVAATPDGLTWVPDAPAWVLVVDEVQDLRDTDALMAIARQGRAFGIHCVAATQVQRAIEVDTRVVAQFGARFCGRVAPSDRWTSRALLGTDDATQLAGPGDMLALIGHQVTRVAVALARADDEFWADARWRDATYEVGSAELDPVPVGGSAMAEVEQAMRVDRRVRHHLTDDVREVIDGLRGPDGRLPGINRTARALGISNNAAERLLGQIAA